MVEPAVFLAAKRYEPSLIAAETADLGKSEWPNRENVSNTVLVTVGLGLVDSATVRRLVELGRRVVATDLDTPANRKGRAGFMEMQVVRKGHLCECLVLSHSSIAVSLILWLARLHPGFHA